MKNLTLYEVINTHFSQAHAYFEEPKNAVCALLEVPHPSGKDEILRVCKYPGKEPTVDQYRGGLWHPLNSQDWVKGMKLVTGNNEVVSVHDNTFAMYHAIIDELEGMGESIKADVLRHASCHMSDDEDYTVNVLNALLFALGVTKLRVIE